VFDLDENFLGIPDLLDPDAGLVLEFDGQDHDRGSRIMDGPGPRDDGR
jgi:hypothetical protein